MAYTITQKVPIVVGVGALQAAAEKIRDELKFKKVLLVYDQNIAKTGNADKVKAAFEVAGLECFVYDKCERDAPEHCCDEVAKMGLENQAEILVAIGGGSTMDTTKGACVVMGNGGKMHDWLMQNPYRKAGKSTVEAFMKPLGYKKNVPCVCIPTTSGTGSESGSWAVIHDEELHMKDCIMYEAEFAVIDPEMTVTCPDFVTTDCAFDALAHAAESITSRNGSVNIYDDMLGSGVTQMVFEYLEKAVKDPGDLYAREKLATAATLAGFCLNYATAHVGHTIADGLLYRFNFSHGYACLLALPGSIELAAPYTTEQVKHLIKAQGGQLTGNETPEELGSIVAENYRKLARACGVKTPKDKGITRDEFISDETVEACFGDKLAIASCPKDNITKEDIRKILIDIYDKL